MLQRSQLDEEFLHLGPSNYTLSNDAKFISQSDFYNIRPPKNHEILKISPDSLILCNPTESWTSSDGYNGIFPTKWIYKRDGSQIEIIKSNNTNTEKFRILTGCSWLHYSTKIIQDGIEYLTIWDDEWISKFYSNGTTEVFDSNNKMIGNGMRWYLIDNETKFKIAGSGKRFDIIKLTSEVFVISREEYNNKGKCIIEATYYSIK